MDGEVSRKSGDGDGVGPASQMGAFIGCLRTQDVCRRAIASNASSIPAFTRRVTTMSIIVPSAI
jgi:hypothetical protein